MKLLEIEQHKYATRRTHRAAVELVIQDEALRVPEDASVYVLPDGRTYVGCLVQLCGPSQLRNTSAITGTGLPTVYPLRDDPEPQDFKSREHQLDLIDEIDRQNSSEEE